MALKGVILSLGLGFALAACDTTDMASRNAPFENVPGGQTSAAPVTAQSGTVFAAATAKGAQFRPGTSPVTVTALAVTVPQTLKVSEQNSYLPSGDIVWREDPIGNRHAQVQKIVKDAITKGVQPLNGPVRVSLQIEIQKFHALTEKARYTTGGVHAITFLMAIRDSKTGEMLVPPRQIRADLDAFGGRKALLAESQGLTQKVRITNHLAEVIRQELTNPDGYKNATTGFIQTLNYL